jgi:hypothetical protein
LIDWNLIDSKAAFILERSKTLIKWAVW